MARSRVVGPDLPSGLRRPDRSVSLRDVRDLPVQRAGFNFDEFDRLLSEGTSKAERTPWDLVEDPATGELVERSELGRGRGSRVERLTDSELDSESRIQRGARLVRQGRHQEAYDVAEEIAEDLGIPGVTAEGIMVDIEIQAQYIDRLEEEGLEEAEVSDEVAQEGAAGAESRGLTADEAFQQYHAMSSGEQPRIDRAHPERPTPPTSREPWVPLSDEQNAINAEGIEEARKTLNGSRNPELRSMDSQMMTDLMAERAAQPEQGYFGGMGNAVQELTETVRAMSGEEQGMMIAALIAAGLLTAGSGGMLAPAGAALMGGAGMAALNQ